MNLFSFAQTLLPQQTLSELAGTLAGSQNPYIKNSLIYTFAKAYDISLNEYQREKLAEYDSFNDFFTRELKDGQRIIDTAQNSIVCPADGTISQIGDIHHDAILQAKGFNYSVGQLLADFELGQYFTDGTFATIYLAPSNYHRVHMPFDGTLIQTQYIPGTLFSVNKNTANNIPDLFARNERLVCVFETDFGMASVVLVGAMIVAGIECVATGRLHRTPYIQQQKHTINLKKGDELGRFYLGSTAIVLLPKSAKNQWHSSMISDKKVMMGEKIGQVEKDAR